MLQMIVNIDQRCKGSIQFLQECLSMSPEVYFITEDFKNMGLRKLDETICRVCGKMRTSK